ncbi:MAG TPA: hypothetical protein PLS66_12870, partial [Tepiditoga sp.]|nr:hypothetical protein [Tepiditoga sp.]
DEGRNTVEVEIDGKNYYVILPSFSYTHKIEEKYSKCLKMSEGFFYRSDTNKIWLNKQELINMINK